MKPKYQTKSFNFRYVNKTNRALRHEWAVANNNRHGPDAEFLSTFASDTGRSV